MSGEVLSQDEVESLLSAMETRTGTAKASPTGFVRPGAKVSPYDFKRPERVGKEQMRALQTMHEGFGRNFGAALSALLRTIVEVKLTSVDQLTYSEFVFSLENPTCFNLINAAPLEGQLILDINLSLLYPIIDRLLGGSSEHSPPIRRPLTEIELRLVSRITSLFLNELKHAWENVLPLNLSVDRVESNPQLVQIVPPNEVVVLISFEITLGDVRGMANLCITYNSIERIGQQLTSNSWVAYGKKPTTPQSIQQISHQLTGSLVELVVDLAETQIATADLVDMQIGDVITTEKDVRTPLVVSIEGRPKFHAEAGLYKGRKAVQMMELIGEPAAKEKASEKK